MTIKMIVVEQHIFMSLYKDYYTLDWKYGLLVALATYSYLKLKNIKQNCIIWLFTSSISFSIINKNENEKKKKNLKYWNVDLDVKKKKKKEFSIVLLNHKYSIYYESMIIMNPPQYYHIFINLNIKASTENNSKFYNFIVNFTISLSRRTKVHVIISWHSRKMDPRRPSGRRRPTWSLFCTISLTQPMAPNAFLRLSGTHFDKNSHCK